MPDSAFSIPDFLDFPAFPLFRFPRFPQVSHVPRSDPIAFRPSPYWPEGIVEPTLSDMRSSLHDYS
jgi:hypothetical protein